MAKVTIKASGATRRIINQLKKSDLVADQLEPFARQVLEVAKRDPNDYYVSTLRMQKFVTGGPLGRVSWQVGAQPGKGDDIGIGGRVEAKRGTLARALGSVGS